ncbi:MAG: [acyl-carrier-protein] S-malonyltransferase [Clostridia bacterium]|nr:ACP S-malonyltransferase [Lachnospiraceae bacterium]NCC01442.1 [acyl-carrier-protein] S-malonyltransferase [Clostridia bacterium]NCD02106.1 [acyl-carrier-protein] S-malonyltransferase [Clostridia bacterium]
MKKTAFIFPGQGAQKFGMGKDFYDALPVSREVYDKASEWLNMDVKSLCFEENDRLDITCYTQIGLLTTELAMLKAVQAKGIVPTVTAGLSLGEYAAITAAGKMSEEDAIKTIEKRGLFMQEAVPVGGAMSAIMGLDFTEVEKICAQTSGIVELANYNCPGQIVISGESEAVAVAGEAIKAAGAKRVAPLKVSGPFHSSMLKGAGEKLKAELAKVTWMDSEIPYISNTTAEIITEPSVIESLLVRQVSESVRWQQSVEQMIHMGVDTFVEIGPGKTLAGFLKRIDRSKTCINIEKIEDLDKLEALTC